jgi:hypothetical protein
MHFDAASALGIAGDSFTVAGGIILLLKDLKAAPEFREVEAARAHLREFQGVPFVTRRGEEINNAEDLQTTILTHYSRRARLAAILIAIGFLLLLVTRLVENSDEHKDKKMQHFRGNAALGMFRT